MGKLEKNKKMQKKKTINYCYNWQCIGCELTVNSLIT
jgi:hypothetical protein